MCKTPPAPKRLQCAIVALVAFVPFLVGAAHAQTYTFTTFAGSPAGRGSVDGTGPTARFDEPLAVATDSTGNVYVVDRSNTIRKITPAGVTYTLAGYAGVIGAADGIGWAARFKYPSGLAVDASGNVFVADGGNNAVRKITPAGVVTTFAGVLGTAGSTDGIGNAALFSSPSSLAFDPAGNLVVLDGLAMRRITPDRTVTTFATLTGYPAAIAIDRNGTIYVSGFNMISTVSGSGVVTTVAGGSERGYVDGTGSAASFDEPNGLACDSSGNVYIADFRNSVIRKMTPSGVVTTFAGSKNGIRDNVDGNGLAARFAFPTGVAFDGSGNLFVADSINHTIRKITPAADVSTLAGLCAPYHLGSSDGTGTAARFDYPGDVVTDAGGNVYLADTWTDTLRKITPAGVVTTIAGKAYWGSLLDGTGTAARLRMPTGLAMDGPGNIYVADLGNNAVRKMTPAGVVTTIATGFSSPRGVAVDASGNVYVTDTMRGLIKKIAPDATVTTFAGSGGYGSTDGPAASATFAFPWGIAVDAGGNVFVADANNDNIRKIAGGVVSTFAGLAGSPGSTDGTGTAARFNSPTGLKIDAAGNLYVADQDNGAIRRITTTGVVTTLGGGAGSGNVDGSGTAVRFNRPTGVVLDGSGVLYVADTENSRIVRGDPALADAAVADAPSGILNTTRQLDTNPKSATSWQWSIVRRPAASAQRLSSASVRNPTFVPDVADLFTFRLDATDGAHRSITTVDILGIAGSPTTTALASSQNPSNVGTSVTFTATVTAGATGPVVFKDGSSTLATVQLNAGSATFTTSSLAAGYHSMTASYGGDSSHAFSASAVLTQVVLNPSSPHGDVNGDGFVNTPDIFYLINHVFAAGPPPVGNGDVNGDTLVNVADIFYLITYFFAGGPPPP